MVDIPRLFMGVKNEHFHQWGTILKNPRLATIASEDKASKIIST
jgi:hypothetical protein